MGPHFIGIACLTILIFLSGNALAQPVQVGERPFYLIEHMSEGALKDSLAACSKGPFQSSHFSIAHRGAPLQFPEHSEESYRAAARMGAGVMECDVTFTKDRELVCRHSQCDLHATTNILATPLAARCSEPFSPATAKQGARARCCTSDITLEEYRSLDALMDGANPAAKTVDEYLKGTPSWRTDAYSPGKLMSFAESVKLFRALGLKLTPELKKPLVTLPFQGDYTWDDYSQQVIDELRALKVPSTEVMLQSFQWRDIAYWLKHAPEFGRQAILLDELMDVDYQAAVDRLAILKAEGLHTIAPPIWALLTLDDNKRLVPSPYALEAKRLGLSIYAWSFERSFRPHERLDYYYQSTYQALKKEGDVYYVLEALHKQVGIKGLFSDWPATVTYYANCFDLP